MRFDRETPESHHHNDVGKAAGRVAPELVAEEDVRPTTAREVPARSHREKNLVRSAVPGDNGHRITDVEYR